MRKTKDAKNVNRYILIDSLHEPNTWTFSKISYFSSFHRESEGSFTAICEMNCRYNKSVAVPLESIVCEMLTTKDYYDAITDVLIIAKQANKEIYYAQI